MSNYIGARADEIFVGNTGTSDGVPEYLRNLKTVRIGDQALCAEGKRIDPKYMRPLFIGRSEAEAYDRAMMDRLTRFI